MVRGFPFFSARAAAALSLLGLLVAALVVPAFASEWAVVGGGPADPAAWPSTVALIRADATDDVAGQFCTGTAVAEDLVLTAAHCFSSITGEQSRTAADVRVVAGRADLTDRSVGTDRLGVDLYVHPDFMAASHRNDVALLRVDAPLGVPIQRLAEAGRATPDPDTVGVILGWGRTGPGPEASSSSTAVLHEAHVPIVAAATCADAFDPSPDPYLHICAGGGGTEDAPRPDACRGDSGGPLLFPVADEPAEQFGITAFGSTECGVGQPGVYASVSAARPFIDDVIAGLVGPTVPEDDPSLVDRVVRVAGDPDTTSAIEQAVASSRAVFAEASSDVAVITRDDAFPDGLAGSALLYGRGPLLFTSAQGPLAEATREELRRALRPGATVYVLGGRMAVPEAAVEAVRAEGFVPIRLAGDSRETTAVAIAEEVVQRYGKDGRPPFGTVVLATSGAWPDAVLAGQLSVWWGYPILLVPADRMPEEVEAALQAMSVDRLLVVGGPSAVSDTVVDAAARASGADDVQRLAGASRAETGSQIAAFHRQELAARGQAPPDTAVAVNVRRDDGFAHILSAVPIVGATAGVFVPVEGEHGDVLPVLVELRICGLGAQPLAVGGHDLVTDDVMTRIARALGQAAC